MSSSYDLVCLSHLRWSFVTQRPQHLLSRAAVGRRVFFFEEPVAARLPYLEITNPAASAPNEGVRVCTPHLPPELSEVNRNLALERLYVRMFRDHEIGRHVLWFYTPMALPFTRQSSPLAVVYDCMDELSAFKGAPSGMRELEAELFRRADVVFTGGHSLYEAKRDHHRNIHAVPSSVDREHFGAARSPLRQQPPDQAAIEGPKAGFFGVIDERFDIELLDDLAALRPDLQFVMIGPVVKIDPATLPRCPNIHWLGARAYADLPAYLAGWDVALLLFARNESTRFISPTKTPEYLAAGRPVVSTSITDVIHPYADERLVEIADTPAEMSAAIDRVRAQDPAARLALADAFLAQMSWDKSWARMRQAIEACVTTRPKATVRPRLLAEVTE
jgi:UDP-galactopyranose mutase